VSLDELEEMVLKERAHVIALQDRAWEEWKYWLYVGMERAYDNVMTMIGELKRKARQVRNASKS